MGRGGSVHMSCFYSNCWPGAWVSDYCLPTNFKQASCWMPRSAAMKLCTSASTEWGLDEALFHRDRLSFLCCSIFRRIGEASLDVCAQAQCSRHTKILETSKRGGCQVILSRIRPLQNFSLSVSLQMCSTDSMLQTRAFSLCSRNKHLITWPYKWGMVMKGGKLWLSSPSRHFEHFLISIIPCAIYQHFDCALWNKQTQTQVTVIIWG